MQKPVLVMYLGRETRNVYKIFLGEPYEKLRLVSLKWSAVAITYFNNIRSFFVQISEWTWVILISVFVLSFSPSRQRLGYNLN
jgi:hypothetical protein